MYHGLTHTIHKRLTEYLDLEDSQIDEITHQLRIILGPATDDYTAAVYTEDDIITKKDAAYEDAHIDGFNEALDFACELSSGTPAEQTMQDIRNKLHRT